MKREIKFRAWDDSPNKQMIPHELLECSIKNMSKKGRYYNQFLHYMQFTGLKDKNEKEIYEGDIITCHTKGIIEWPHKGVVEYVNSYFGINVGKEILINSDNDYYTHFWNNKDFEVIGNIYENPELITPSQTIKQQP